MLKANVLAFLISFVALSSICSSTVYAGLGASPGSVAFLDVLRGGYSETYLIVSNVGEEQVQINMGPEGVAADWLSMDNRNFTLGTNERKVVKVIAQPPLDTPNGVYGATLFITAIPLSALQSGGQTGLLVTWGVDIPITVAVTDQQIMNYSVEAFYVSDAEECKMIQTYVNVKNMGNVRVTPVYHMQIVDSVTRAVIKDYDYTAESLLPTQIRTDIVRIPYELAQFRCIPQAGYRMLFDAYFNNTVIYNTDKYFQILPPGTLTILGNLKGITYKKIVDLGESVKIEGTFINVGEETVLSKLRCEIYGQNNTFLEVVESDQREVVAGKEEKLNAYYSPKSPGDQVVKCVVNYENKVTLSAEDTLKVNIPVWMIYAVILVVIIIIIYLAWRFTRGKGKNAVIK